MKKINVEDKLKEYDKIIPNQVLFNLKKIEEIGIAKISMMKKLITNGEISIVKIGNKIHVSRSEIIRFMAKNTVDTQNQFGC